MTSTIQGQPVSPTPAAEGETLVMTSGAWTPGSAGGGGGLTVQQVPSNANQQLTGPNGYVPAPFQTSFTSTGKATIINFHTDLAVGGASLSDFCQLEIEIDGSSYNVGGFAYGGTRAESASFITLPINLQAVIPPGLSVGSHTLKIKFTTDGGNAFINNSGYTTWLNVVEG